jgi:2'-5' RNA ligase
MAIRLFCAVEIPDDVSERLIAIQRGVPNASWSPRENLHLTLRFFGDVPEPTADEIDSALDEVAAGAAPFEMRLKGAGFFGGDNPHALYIGVAPSEALQQLAADCERAARRAGVKPETRKYTPHVTLAYLNRPDLQRVIAFERNHALYESRAWDVRSFTLFSSWSHKSGKNTYRPEADYELRG